MCRVPPYNERPLVYFQQFREPPKEVSCVAIVGFDQGPADTTIILLMDNDLEFTIDALLWEKYEGHELPLLAKITHKECTIVDIEGTNK